MIKSKLKNSFFNIYKFVFQSSFKLVYIKMRLDKRNWRATVIFCGNL